MRLLLTLFVMLTAACATTTNNDAGMQEQVSAATAAWRAAYDSRDPVRITALYDPSAVLWGTTARTLAPTPAAVGEYFKDAASRPDARVILGEQVIRLYGETAVNTGYYAFADVRDGQSVQRPARFTFVLRRVDGKWLIVAHHSSLVP